ncbi:MAG: hypothetical protein J5809_06080 [Selenomonadaceae bacterium]|nr:hypothetical protein [Selenomonadaceae bacterium]
MQYFLIIVVIAFVLGLARAMRMSGKSVALIEKYEGDFENPALVEEIYAAVSADFFLSRIVKKYGATLEDFRKLNAKLMIWGDFRKYNRYVPITSFFNRTTLEYLLAHKNDDARALTEKMMNHFHI